MEKLADVVLLGSAGSKNYYMWDIINNVYNMRRFSGGINEI